MRCLYRALKLKDNTEYWNFYMMHLYIRHHVIPATILIPAYHGNTLLIFSLDFYQQFILRSLHDLPRNKTSSAVN